MNQDWFQKNIVSICIALVGIISTYAVYGYKISALEARAAELEGDIKIIASIAQNLAVLSTKTENIESDVAEMKSDIKDITRALNVSN